jgi:RNase H-like domain found in reverse transcriptase
MSPPTTGDQLMQFVCALGWLRTSLPDFTTLLAPLADLMKKVYYVAGGLRTKRAVSKISLVEVGWSQNSTACFERCKNALLHAISLAHRNEILRLCVYTDASERHWSSVITQVPHTDLNENHADQQHEPLAFLSGTFTGAPFRWSIADKEGYAIMQTCERMDYLLRCPAGFSLFSDRRNLVYIFDPRGQNPGLAQHSEARALRWALNISSYNYVIEFIPGVDNVWADLLSRWVASAVRRLSLF